MTLFSRLIGIERAQSVASPACHEIGLTCSLVFILLPLEPCCEFEECAEEGCAIIVQQLDQPGLLDEAAEFDEVAGAGAPVLDPLAGVVAGAGGVEAVTQHGQAL
jgi:hypothetical protein